MVWRVRRVREGAGPLGNQQTGRRPSTRKPVRSEKIIVVDSYYLSSAMSRQLQGWRFGRRDLLKMIQWAACLVAALALTEVLHRLMMGA